MRAAVALLLLAPPLAGCLDAPVSPPASTAPGRTFADPLEARMAAYLRDEYPRADAVEWDAFRILDVQNETVGDVPLVRVVAVVTREGKEAVAWFDARDLRFVADLPPTYAQASGSKMDWALAQALANATGEPLDVSVGYGRPPGMLVADDVLEPALVDLALAAALDAEMHRLASLARNRTLTQTEMAEYRERAEEAMRRRNAEVLPPYMEARAAELRNVTGVSNATLPYEGAMSVHAWATPDAVRAIAARPEVLSLALNRVEQASGWDGWGADWR